MNTPPTRSPELLPHTFWAAAARAARGTCPRCGQGSLFARWLKPRESCPSCGQDWTYERADDLPAYIAILVTGHLLAPVIIALGLDFDLSPLTMSLILIPLVLVLMPIMLQPSKGVVIAIQWWHGMHGFRKERPAGHPEL